MLPPRANVSAAGCSAGTCVAPYEVTHAVASLAAWAGVAVQSRAMNSTTTPCASFVAFTRFPFQENVLVCDGQNVRSSQQSPCAPRRGDQEHSTSQGYAEAPADKGIRPAQLCPGTGTRHSPSTRKTRARRTRSVSAVRSWGSSANRSRLVARVIQFAASSLVTRYVHSSVPERRVPDRSYRSSRTPWIWR